MKYSITIVLALLIAGCGGGGGGGNEPTPLPPAPAPSPSPDSTALLLPPGSAADFDDWIRDGLNQWAGLAPNSGEIERALMGPDSQVQRSGAAIESVAFNADTASGSTVSTTNLIVAGVDEIDAARYDGDYIYLANNDHLQIIDAAPGETSNVVATLRLSEDRYAGSQGLYHLKNASISRLVHIRAGSYYSSALTVEDASTDNTDAQDTSLAADSAIASTSLPFAPWGWSGTSHVDLIDVDSPSAPVLAEQISIDGRYVNSRRIGETLILITRYSPSVNDIVPFATTEQDKANNQNIIDGLETNDLLPRIRFGDGTDVPLVTADRCLVPNSAVADEDAVYYPSITTVTAIDLTAPNSFSSLCLSEGVAGVSVSTDAVYLAAMSPFFSAARNYFEETLIHKISISESDPTYIGTGKLPGTFWGEPAFLMGEHDGALTAITTSFGPDVPEHHLTVLGEGSDFTLEQLGQIPNASRPEKIGKPGEQIYASRIVGDRAYVVTFQQIDPVYVIDLAIASDPQILGELEIPGFSNYLHPVSDDLLLGIGNDVEANGDGRQVTEGVNVRLFDVSDPTAPAMVGEASIGRAGTYTPAAWDLHALTTLEAGDTLRVALPIQVRGGHIDEPVAGVRYYPWTENSLFLFEVDSAARTLTEVGKIVAEDHSTGNRYQPNCCVYNERSFMNGDAVFFLNKARLVQASWANTAPIENLFVPSLFPSQGDVSTLEARNGLRVNLLDAETGDYLECGDAVAVDGDFKAQVPTCYEDRDVGLFERPGSYRLTVSGKGYIERSTDDVRVQSDGFHVGETWIDFYLNRELNAE